MRLLVTGSSGQIGSYVVEAARTAGHEVAGLDSRPSRWTTHVGDVCKAEAVADATAGVDAVVHLAARVSVQASVEDPRTDAEHNVLGTLTVLDAARRADVARFVNVSSAAVYGDPVVVPVAEDHPRRPLSPYGAGKLAGEEYARLHHSLYGLDIVTVRPFNVYSPRQDSSNPYSGVMSHFAARVRVGRPPIVHGDGSQTRDFVHARDVAAWLLLLARNDSTVAGGTALNLATGRETSILTLANVFVAQAGRQTSPVHVDARAGDIKRSVAEVSLARKHGLLPTVDLDDGVREMMTT